MSQKRRAEKVVKLCDIEPRRGRLFAKKLGVRIPGGSKPAADVRNVCHVLGVALSKLFRGESSFAYPVRVAGSGVAGLAFFMDDGTVIKTVELEREKEQGDNKRPAFRGEHGLAPGGKAIPLGHFVHEIAMTRKARKLFGRVFNVPKVMRSVVLRGAKGVRIAVMQQGRAPGVTLAAFLRDDKVPLEVRHRAARMWGRANTRRGIVSRAKDPSVAAALWTKFLRYETAFPYNDMMTHGPGRGFAENYLAGLYPSAKDKAKADAIRADYHGLVNNNYMAMFRALDLVTRSLN